jgi:hypothetical protein
MNQNTLNAQATREECKRQCVQPRYKTLNSLKYLDDEWDAYFECIEKCNEKTPLTAWEKKTKKMIERMEKEEREMEMEKRHKKKKEGDKRQERNPPVPGIGNDFPTTVNLGGEGGRRVIWGLRVVNRGRDAALLVVSLTYIS